MTNINSICVYCGSSPGNNPIYTEAAVLLGEDIARNDLRLVYGGGTRGIMGSVAKATLNAGGKVLGVIPRFLMNKEATEAELGNITRLIVTEDMHERKHALFENANAFVAMPGGIGTVEEIVEVMTWAQLGRHTKPMVFANINGFWNPMLDLLSHMKAEGFIHTANLVNPLVIDKVEDIVPTIVGIWNTAKISTGSKAVLDRL